MFAFSLANYSAESESAEVKIKFHGFDHFTAKVASWTPYESLCSLFKKCLAMAALWPFNHGFGVERSDVSQSFRSALTLRGLKSFSSELFYLVLKVHPQQLG